MDQATHNKIVSFIWGIADDVLRDLFKRGKYPDVILPLCVLRRMDAVLEPTKKTVLDTKEAAILAFCGEGKMALALLRNAIEHNYCGGPALDKDPLWANVRVTEEFGRLRSEAEKCQKRFQALLQ